MRSILDLSKNKNLNCKALNFTVVGYGAYEEIRKFAKHLQATFSDLVNIQNIRIFNENTLSRAECIPTLLSKPNLLRFPCGVQGCSKNYYGYFDCKNTDKLYHTLYDSRGPRPMPPAPPYYSKNALLTILKEKFGKYDCPDECCGDDIEMISDIEIAYSCAPIDSEIGCVQLEYHLNGRCFENELDASIAQCNAWIDRLDELFPECFHSAYLSYALPSLSVLHRRLYRLSDRDTLGSHLLGAEWCGYISERLIKYEDLKNNEQLDQNFELCKRTSGTRYACKGSILSFEENYRPILNEALKSSLMPGYEGFDWEQLHNLPYSVNCFPKTVHVFCSFPNTYNIIFSYGVPLKEIMSLWGLRQQDWMDTFQKR